MKRLLFFAVVSLCLSFCVSSVFAFSYSFLGAYKKTSIFYKELNDYSQKYDGNVLLAVVIAMYESGGNDQLVSWAGAEGLMQVIPSTHREMNVKSRTEAGVKYLSVLKRQLSGFLFGENKLVSVSRLHSYVVLAYNGGPGRVRSGFIRIESYQYLQGVSLYFNLLSQRQEEIKKAAENLETFELRRQLTWQELSERFKVSVLELRLYNPFLAHRRQSKIPKGWVVVYPKKAGGISLENKIYYVVKQGDILHHLANAFGFTYDEMRNKSGLLLWGSLQPGDKIDVSNSPYLP